MGTGPALTATDEAGYEVVAMTLAAIVMLAWGLLLGLGDGVYFVIPALILGAAAVASITPRRGIPASDYRNRLRTRS
ncbi:hypothetical protein [Verrucosispora sp. WMMD1129]|uniref:hypothetical protein n=1 Tax=Verrucosispora sp. WMMD1129 TaxID=3016093 RepID=UPI00249C60D4|nr:hypothetical protein [Verrucosispora sp. WMMD1129]WFE43522.1 hypothetical protein O7624_03865 [Verrucosispora sp. WMMD1129]